MVPISPPETLFTLIEEALDKDLVVATYYLGASGSRSLLETAKRFAVGQTLGTWLDVPGIDNRMRQKHLGRIINVYEIPPRELAEYTESVGRDNPNRCSILQVGFPFMNFESSLTMLMTTVLGNDASTAVQAKLLDLAFPRRYVEQFRGPRLGLAGVRESTGVKEGPVLLNMIKPCTGYDPRTGADLFERVAMAGVDIVKDDELLGGPAFSPVTERVRLYKEAARHVFEKTGRKVKYFPNVSGALGTMLDTARRAVALGADGIMFNFVYGGLDTLAALAGDPEINVPIMVHYAGAGSLFEGATCGISSMLLLGKLPRLAGADIVHCASPYGGYPYLPDRCVSLVHTMRAELRGLKPVFPAVGGAITPGNAFRLVRELGEDIILAVGGSIQGHPQGPIAGVNALRAAIEASLSGVSLDEAALNYPELDQALKLWGRA